MAAGTHPTRRTTRAKRPKATESDLRDDLKDAIQLAQQCWIVARDADWAWQQFLCEVRLIARELGRRLARAGVIEKSADAFYLSPEELWATAGHLHDGRMHSQKDWWLGEKPA